jgi:hypothetical protein
MEILELKVSNTEIKLYSNIDNLPICRYNEMKKFLALAWVGDPEIEGIIKHFQNLNYFITHDKKEEALKESGNMMYGLTMIIGAINPKHVAFAHLIHSINGEEIDDYGDDNLLNVLEDLSKKGLTEEMLNDYLTEVKKKLIAA